MACRVDAGERITKVGSDFCVSHAAPAQMGQRRRAGSVSELQDRVPFVKPSSKVDYSARSGRTLRGLQGTEASHPLGLKPHRAVRLSRASRASGCPDR